MLKIEVISTDGKIFERYWMDKTPIVKAINWTLKDEHLLMRMANKIESVRVVKSVK